MSSRKVELSFTCGNLEIKSSAVAIPVSINKEMVSLSR